MGIGKMPPADATVMIKPASDGKAGMQDGKEDGRANGKVDDKSW